MRLASEYLRTRRGRASVFAAACAVAIASTVLLVGLTAPAGQRGASIALSGLALLAGEVAFAVGAGSAVRARRSDLATLRALGWRQRQVRGHLMASFSVIAVAAAVPALLATLAVTALLGGGPAQAGLALLSLPGTFGMVLVGAWWPVRRATGERGGPMSSPPGRLGRGRLLAGGHWLALMLALELLIVAVSWLVRARRSARPRRWLPAGEVARSLLRTPVRTAAGALVIAAASLAVSVELAVWLHGAAWLGHPASWQVSAIDIAAVVVIAVLAAGTVADLDWLSARERAAESSTLRAIGWSARRMARQVAGEAVLLGAVAGVIDMVGSLALAHGAMTAGTATPGVVARAVAVAVAAGAVGVVISLLGAATAALLGREGHEGRRAAGPRRPAPPGNPPGQQV
ncbi:MAG TPA: FtsX-like permease family protein [Trebonia sp.]|nr:FtsX-like permease family protein [Trebonia sp.]